VAQIGEQLRLRRVEVLGKGLREMAGLLSIAPAHLTDIEKGRRSPSEELMLRIAERYMMPIAELRAGWSRADAVVSEVANQDATTAVKVPEFLRTARNLTPAQWDKMIEQARKLSESGAKRRQP
jgi:transcriptional regulator with XRE-family HTH domain